MKIREAHIEDLPDLMRMAKSFHYMARLKRFKSFEENQKGWKTFLINAIKMDGFLCLVAETEDEELCGFFTALMAPVAHIPSILGAYETCAWVDEGARRGGCATKLIDEYCKWAKGADCAVATLGSYKGFGWNKAHALYRGLGFELLEKQYVKEL